MTIILDPQSPRLGVVRRRRSQGYLDDGFPAGMQHRVLGFEFWVSGLDVTERLYKRLKTQNSKPKTQNSKLCMSRSVSTKDSKLKTVSPIDPNSRHSIVSFQVGRKAVNILSDKSYGSFNRNKGSGFRS
jgi:hypothetical protein